MPKRTRVLIIGGGISGLTFANLLSRSAANKQYEITVLEMRSTGREQFNSIGGGIGLWPTSQSVLKYIPGYESFIKENAFLMPSPSYRDSKANILAKPRKDFSERFPVQSINRDDLLSFLLSALNETNVKIAHSSRATGYYRQEQEIIVTTENEERYSADIIIAADGIHSKIRECLLAELQHKPFCPKKLGYTYYRANTIMDDKLHWETAFETWGTGKTQKYGQHEVRFGFVPLKPPEVFWFIAIKTIDKHPILQPNDQVHIVDEEAKQFLLEIVKNWKPIKNDNGQILVDYQDLITKTDKILRTDISKIEKVTKFPWLSKDNKIILMGDAAHATAPNVAQGAGLCIEDAACLVDKLNSPEFLLALSDYSQERKPRAFEVQTAADTIATIGSIKASLLKKLRNQSMIVANKLLPNISAKIFEKTVSYSLGGTRRKIFWRSPQLSMDKKHLLFESVFPEVNSLNSNIKSFKTSPIGGFGNGIVTVNQPSVLSKMFCHLFGLPKTMIKEPFYAEVINISYSSQCWKRVFAQGKSYQKTYQTEHNAFVDRNLNCYLNESVGGVFNKLIQFVYTIEKTESNILKYQSQGVTLFNLIKAPLPRWCLPSSSWTEEPTREGWKFDGVISVPILGKLMHYHGNFQIGESSVKQQKRILVVGGSGLVGRAACLHFQRIGYEVFCLSRSEKTDIHIAGIKVINFNKDWSNLINNETIILNVSGSNPGTKRWHKKVMDDILQSRLKAIEVIKNNIERAPSKPRKYLQASAAGYYGDAKGSFLTEDRKPVENTSIGTLFRIDACKEIESKANQLNCDVINIRIGHVFANEGGLLPKLKFASHFVNKFGSGEQFVPFVHIKDVARAIAFMADSTSINSGPVNLASPNPCTNQELLSVLKPNLRLIRVTTPKSLLKLMFGESSVVLTDSEPVIPERLLQNGFNFNYPTISDTLNALQ